MAFNEISFFFRNILKKNYIRYKKIGLIYTACRLIKFPIVRLIYLHKKKKIFQTNKGNRFNKIYELNFWNNNESVSGSGSSLKNTRKIRTLLPKIIRKYNIKSVLDAPCGDFYWFNKIIDQIEINYLGGDIVGKLINENKKKFKSKKINFKLLDITKNNLPKMDLMICRDCLFHLSYEDIQKFLLNYKRSKIKFIMLTANKNYHDKDKSFNNKNITTGDFRKIDFFSAPFNFKKNYELSFIDEDIYDTNNSKYIYLFSRKNFIKNINIFLILDHRKTINRDMLGC